MHPIIVSETVHPAGESKIALASAVESEHLIDTPGGRYRASFDDRTPVSALGALVFFAQYLQAVVRRRVVVAQKIPFPVVLSAVGKSVERIEAAAVGQMVPMVESIVPLADERGGVARMTKVVPKGLLGQIEPVEPAIARHIDGSGAVIVAPGEKAGAGRRAER